MRRIDQAELFEIRHDVAHRSRRQRHRQDARQIARADRLAGREIALDDQAEDLARALVELGQARWFAPSGKSWLAKIPIATPNSRQLPLNISFRRRHCRRRRAAQQIHELARPSRDPPADRPPTTASACGIGQNALRHKCGISARSAPATADFRRSRADVRSALNSACRRPSRYRRWLCEPFTAGSARTSTFCAAKRRSFGSS